MGSDGMLEDEKNKILELFDNLRRDKYPLQEYSHIGRRGVRRLDGYEKASGKAVYTIDVALPGMLHAKFLTSPYTHARIVRMDTGKAEALPGVRAILRYDDPELPPRADLGGHVPNAIPVLPAVAYFQGEEVGAFVAADTEAIADEALRSIEVEWEERPFVLDAEEGLKPEAPLVNPEMYPNGNYYNEGFLDVEQHGDIERGFAEADKIIEFKCKRLLHTWIGPERPCGVFRWNGEYPEIWVKQQRPLINKRVLSAWYGGVPMNRIQVHCPYQGAIFGGGAKDAPWQRDRPNVAALHRLAVPRRFRQPQRSRWTFPRHSRRPDAGEMGLQLCGHSPHRRLAVRLRPGNGIQRPAASGLPVERQWREQQPACFGIIPAG